MQARLEKVAGLLLLVLFFRVVFSILSEYQFYFPADFRAPFLVNREAHFQGWYFVAFYVHIVISPVVLLMGLYLVLSGKRKGWRSYHKIVGRVQVPLIVLFVAPSGFVMANKAYSGPIAGSGFALLAIATAGTAMIAVREAMAHRIASHKIWATRCFVLLCSPLVLRLTSGSLSVLNAESDWTYRVSAWASWLVPLLIFETYLRHSKSNSEKFSRDSSTATEFRPEPS